MDQETLLLETEDDMEKVIAYMNLEFSGVRTGKASPSLVENMDINISSYGSMMKLKAIAVITTPDARSILIQPFDPGTLHDIERAIRESRLNLNPHIDARSVRVPIPELSQERRKDLVKHVKQLSEDARVRLRAARKEGMDKTKKLKADSLITEDDQRTLETKIQKMTDSTGKLIEEATLAKEKEIMTV
ncbi:MAG: ribosome recycling factor [Akkermansia sp.]